MTGIEAFVTAAVLTWFLVFLTSLVKLLVKAQTPQEHDSAMRILTGTIIGGIVIVIGPSIGMWITGLHKGTLTNPETGKQETVYYTGDDINNKDNRLPFGTGHVLDTVISLLRITGGLVVVVGLLWGGISFRVRAVAPWVPLA